MIDYNEIITIKLTRNEWLQILDLMIDIVGMGYDPNLIRNLHHKIFDQVFDEVTLEFKGVQNAK